MSRSRYRVRRLETLLPASMPPLDTLAQFTDFLRSDHARFWYSNEFHARRSFSSLLVTDTGEAPGGDQVLQKVSSEANPKVCNHGEGPY